MKGGGTIAILAVGVLALGAGLYALTRPASPDDVFRIEAGKRYRFTVTATPKLDDAGVEAARVMLGAQGMTNLEVLQNDTQTIVTWDAPTQEVSRSLTRGQGVLSLGGVTYAIDNVEEIPAQAV